MKKYLLTLGTFATLTVPLISVIACTTNYSYSKNDQSVIDKSTSPSSLQQLEIMWLKKTLKIKDTFALNSLEFKKDFTQALAYLLSDNSKKSNTYFLNLLKTISLNDKTKTNEITNAAKVAGIEKATFSTNSADKIIEKLITPNMIGKLFFNILKRNNNIEYNPNTLHLKTDVLKMMVVAKYMSITTKNYKKVFDSKYYTIAKKVIGLTLQTTKDFPLIVEMIKQSLGYEWAFKLNADDSAQWITGKANKYSMTKIDALISKGGAIANLIKYTDKNSFMSKYSTYLTPNIFVGYQGTTNIDVGINKDKTASLKDLTHQELKTILKTILKTGYLHNKNIIEKDIPLLNSKFLVELHKVKMLLPSWDDKNHELTIKLPNINKNFITYALLKNNKGLYDDAIKYFSSKENPIQIEIHNKAIYDIWKKLGINYLVYKEK